MHVVLNATSEHLVGPFTVFTDCVLGKMAATVVIRK